MKEFKTRGFPVKEGVNALDLEMSHAIAAARRGVFAMVAPNLIMKVLVLCWWCVCKRHDSHCVESPVLNHVVDNRARRIEGVLFKISI